MCQSDTDHQTQWSSNDHHELCLEGLHSGVWLHVRGRPEQTGSGVLRAPSPLAVYAPTDTE